MAGFLSMDLLYKLFKPYGIDRIGLCLVSDLDAANVRMSEDMLRRGMISAVMFLMPYYVEEDSNIAMYASPRDYHAFALDVTLGVIKSLRAEYPTEDWAGYSDNAPFGEVKAAAMSGLGVIGDNGLLLTPDYGSYVFIGGIYTTLALPEGCISRNIERCEGCGACLTTCPVGLDKELCLSRLSQKKGVLDKSEEQLLRENGIIWGCDICQRACPHNSSPKSTPISYFKEKRLPVLDSEMVNSMSKDEFESRAYSWRGRQTILRNLKINGK